MAVERAEESVLSGVGAERRWGVAGHTAPSFVACALEVDAAAVAAAAIGTARELTCLTYPAVTT